jgi:SAM-dependent methyltransferase
MEFTAGPEAMNGDLRIVSMPDSALYSTDFFDRHSAGSRNSAQEIVPIMVDLLAPRSVIDVGCGVGTWLAVFSEQGVTDIYGIDGDYVEASQLQIPPEKFKSVNLAEPFEVGRKFDLVVTVEVAEHLPSESARSFVHSLTKLGPTVLFSAAIPHQGGDGHINEQWPEYWARLFREFGYVVVDCVRNKIWKNDNVEWWYAQNILLFVDLHASAQLPHLTQEIEQAPQNPLAIVHPKKFLDVVDEHDRRTALAAKLLATIPPETTYILVGMDYWFVGIDCWYSKLLTTRTARPFLERDGEYWGKPETDARAVQELDRMRTSGAEFIAFPRSEWWWFEAYPGMHGYLYSEYTCCFADDHVIIFDLRSTKVQRSMSRVR